MESNLYRRTLTACNLAAFIQSATMNLAPFLFLTLNRLYGISFTELGFLVLVNFTAQFVADLIFAAPVNRFGFRPFCVGSQLGIFLGLSLFAAAPLLAPGREFPLLVLATVLYSAATGLLEVLLSPITKSIPAESSHANFMIMHTAFAAGILAVALVSTGILTLPFRGAWQLAVLFWALPPAFNAFRFMKAPMPEVMGHPERMRLRDLLGSPVFGVSFLAIFFGAATELLIVQWGSAYLEEGLGLSKATGDLAGLCVFALMLAAGRFLFARMGKRADLHNLMIRGSLMCVILYALVALAPVTWVVLMAFGLIGFFSCLLWTGTLFVAADALPRTGAVIFALLAGGGDLGTAALGQLTGWLADRFTQAAPAGIPASGYGMRMALTVMILVPVLSLLFQLLLKKAVHSHPDAAAQ